MWFAQGKPIGEIRTPRDVSKLHPRIGNGRHMKPKGNAGVFVWADDITAKGQPFIRGSRDPGAGECLWQSQVVHDPRRYLSDPRRQDDTGQWAGRYAGVPHRRTVPADT